MPGPPGLPRTEPDLAGPTPAALARRMIPRPPVGPSGRSRRRWAGLDAAGPSRHRPRSRWRRALGRDGRSGRAAPAPPGPVRLRHRARRSGATASSAVLVALFEEDGETRVVLTRRSVALRAHRGEVSFPGGRIEPGEEVGRRRPARGGRGGGARPGVGPAGRVAPPGAHLLVGLAHHAGRRRCWPPARTWWPARPRWTGSSTWRWPTWSPTGVFHEERWRVPERPATGSADGSFPVWFFEVAGETVWGATARILIELVCLVLGLAPDRPADAGRRARHGRGPVAAR